MGITVKCRSIWKVLPVPMFQAKLKKGRAAWHWGFFVLIDPKYWGDRKIEAHELMHSKQFWKTLGFSFLLYLISEKYRLKYEVEAYKEQVRLSNSPIEDRMKYAHLIADRYDIDVDFKTALRLLGGIP